MQVLFTKSNRWADVARLESYLCRHEPAVNGNYSHAFLWIYGDSLILSRDNDLDVDKDLDINTMFYKLIRNLGPGRVENNLSKTMVLNKQKIGPKLNFCETI